MSTVWATTLPRVVAPLPGEGLTGLRLRGDEANAASSGTTVRMTSRRDGGGSLAANRVASQFVPSDSTVTALASLLGLPAEAIEACTLRSELRRLYGPSVSARSMGPEQSLAICPACMDEERLVRLEFAFPFVRVCEHHAIELITRCTCGQRLRAFTGLTPFTCPARDCARPWSELLRRPVGDRTLLRQRRLLHAYRVFLAYPDEGFVPAARAAIGLARPPAWMGGFLAPEHPLPKTGRAIWLSSVGAFAQAFVDLAIPPERVLEVFSMPPERRGSCLNAKCRFFASDRQIRHNGVRNGEWESYCTECGSRFLGDRIVMSFDSGNGDPRLSAGAVRRAQARLERWRIALAEVVGRALENGYTMTRGEAMAAAGIPENANLRARGLGLATLAARLRGVGDPVPVSARRHGATPLAGITPGLTSEQVDAAVSAVARLSGGGNGRGQVRR